jgi:(R,R)-butanediol dehydrogenase/meso-butanediol dehydrogenase/diacetyl reductase
MRAARLHGARDIRVEEVPEPEPGPGDVLLRPRFTGLCGSDLHMWRHGSMGAATSGPLVLGHEFSAEVVEVGPAVTDPRIRPGALVALEPLWRCGTCAPCRRGAYNLCRNLRFHGLSDHDGSLGELTVARPDMIHVLPEGLDAVHGALIEPIAVAHHAVGRCGLGPGGSAVVLGAGPVGLAAALDIVARGVERLVVSEPAPARRAATSKVLAAVGAAGAVVLDPARDDLAEAVAEVTGGEGADAVLDAAGAPAAFEAGLTAVRPGGRVVVVATYLQPVSFHPLTTVLGEIDLLGSIAYRDDFPPVIDLVADGRFPIDGWVERIPLAGVSDGFATLEAGSGIKLLVQVND